MENNAIIIYGEIQKRGMVMEFFRTNRTYCALVLALFLFVFLGTEYLFDDRMASVTDAPGVVAAQSYILAASVIGFAIFPVFYRCCKRYVAAFLLVAACLVSVICYYMICCHSSYQTILIAGVLLYIGMGVLGGAIHYGVIRILRHDPHLAAIVGCSYMAGIMLQFVNNNLVGKNSLETILLSICSILLAGITVFLFRQGDNLSTEKLQKQSYITGAGIMLVVCVLLMTIIFATLDNVVTLYHAGGSMDIGQCPRLLLAFSGLIAGFLYDIRNRHYMNLIMYCVTLLSVICVLLIVSGRFYFGGLPVFYLSAGFFAVYFTTSFMEYALYTGYPAFWAGFGRAVNNIGAGLIGSVSITMFEKRNFVLISMIAVVLFVCIHIALYMYSGWMQKITGNAVLTMGEKEEQRFADFAAQYHLTAREQEVLQALLESDDSVQNIAEQLYISRAALYRHITSINKKTNTRSRVGLIQFYYGRDGESSKE